MVTATKQKKEKTEHESFPHGINQQNYKPGTRFIWAYRYEDEVERKYAFTIQPGNEKRAFEMLRLMKFHAWEVRPDDYPVDGNW